MSRDELIKIAVRIASTILGSAMQALLVFRIARDVGPSTFSGFGQFTSLSYAFGAFVSLGFGVRVLRMGSDHKDRRLVGTMFILRTVLSVVLVVLIGLAMLLSDSAKLVVCVAGSLFILAEMHSELVQNVLAGRERQNLGSLTVVVQRAAGVGLSFALHGGGMNWWESLALAQLTVLIGLWLVAVLLSSKPVSPVRVIRGSGGYLLATTVPNLYQFDTTIAGVLSGPQTSGVMAAGSRLSAPLSLVSGALLTTFVPKFARNKREGVDPSTSFNILLRWTLVYSAGLILISPFIALALTAYLGSEYRGGFIYFTALGVAASISTISQVFQAEVYSLGKPLRVARTMAIGVGVGLVGLTSGLAVAGLKGAFAGPLLLQAAILLVYVRDSREASQPRARQL